MGTTNIYIERIQNALQQSIHKMQPEMTESMNKHAVTPTQFFVLMLLKKKESAKISEIAELMGVKPSAVSFMVDRLEHNDYVYREHDKKDRRVVNIMLSDFGKEKLDQVITERKAIVDKYLLQLTEEELVQFANLTERIAEIVSSSE